MNNEKQMNYDDNEVIIDLRNVLKDMFSCIRRYWIVMVMICIVLTAAGGAYAVISYKPVYKFDVIFTVMLKDNKNIAYEYTYNTSGENQLEKPLDGIVASEHYRQMICQGLGVVSFDEKLTLSSVLGTNQFRLTAEGNEPGQVLKVLNTAAAYLAEAASDTTGRMKINIIQEAREITPPLNAPPIKKTAVLGAAAGIFICLAGMVLYIVRRINCVHKEADLKDILNIRSYGTIVRSKPDTIQSAALRIRKDLDEKQKKVILTEGCISDSEIAEISLALAQMLAAAGKKVLLVDCNLAAPQYTELVKEARMDDGLSRFLAGKNHLQFCLCRLTEEYVDLIGNSEPVTEFSRLLSLDSFERLTEEARNRYDYIVFSSAGKKSLCGREAAAACADSMIYLIDRGLASQQRIYEEIEELSGQRELLAGGIFFVR